MFTPHRDFCHISPTAYLSDFCRGRPNHLALAHLVERDQQYTEFYLRESLEGATIILDNSAFEQYILRYRDWETCKIGRAHV